MGFRSEQASKQAGVAGGGITYWLDCGREDEVCIHHITMERKNNQGRQKTSSELLIAYPYKCCRVYIAAAARGRKIPLQLRNYTRQAAYHFYSASIT